MPNYNVVEETSGGWQKVEYPNLGTTGYRTPDGTPGSTYEEETGKSAPHAFSASKGQEESVVVRNTETGEFITRAKESEVLEVTGQADAGERGATDDSPTFEVEVRDLDQARAVLEEQREDWEAWQLYGLWAFECRNGDSDGETIVNGWSKVKDHIGMEEYREPVVGVDDDGNDVVRGFETVQRDTVALAYQEASDNAWSKVTCSPIKWENRSLQVKLYAPPQSSMLQDARNRSHIQVEA